MKTLASIFIILILTVSVFSQDYSTEAEVISSGAGLSTSGSDCFLPESICNFGIIGETFVKSNLQGGSFSGSAGFMFLANPDICTNVDPLQRENNSIQLYPVPVSNYLNVRFSDFNGSAVQVLIYDILGKVIYQGNFNPKENEQIKINLSSERTGIYLFKAVTSNGEFKRKIVINN